jgi:hypothetical protein
MTRAPSQGGKDPDDGLRHHPSPTEGVISKPCCQRGLTEATMAEAISFSPSPTANEVDMLYHQLAEIHTIGGATQLAECAR